MNSRALVLLVGAGICGIAAAQPRIVVLNPGVPQGVSDDGQRAFGGASAYTVGSNSMTIGALTGASPSATKCSNDGLFASGTVGGAASRWDATAGAWTNAPLAATITNIGQAPRDISSTGRFIVGQCSTSGAGSFAGYVCDYGQNPPVTTKLLGTTTTARACGVSSDGTVIVGGESPNVAGTTSGGRPGVWRWNPVAGAYDWSYLPDGPVDANGGTAYRTVDNFLINDAGTVIVGNAFRYNPGTGFPDALLTRWTWDAGTSTWGRQDLYNMSTGALTISSWWTPLTDCNIPPSFTPTAMTNDGQTIVGILEYSTCGSFIRGGFIFAAGEMADLSDYLTARNVDLATAGFGPYSSSGFGLSHLGYALDISDDGQHLVGAPSLDPDTAGSWLIDLNAPGAGCIPPVIATNPAATTNISACSGTQIFNVSAAGSPPIAMQWTKDNSDIFDGPSGNGSTYQILAVGKQLRILGPISQADAGTYACRASNGCGSATSAGAVVQLDPAIPAATNDTCATAQTVSMGTNVLGAGQSPCGAWVNETYTPNCVTTGAVRADRWYVFTPSITQEYRLETCGSNFDTVLTVYSDCFGNEVACSDDYNTGPSAGCSSNRSRVGRVHLNQDTAYLIRISARQNASLSGSSLMNLSILAAPAAPANDSCLTPATAVIGANAFDTTEAGNDMTASCNNALSRDVFFSYVPPSQGRIRVSTCPGTTWNTVLSILDGVCGSELACNDNANVTGCSTQSVIDNFRVDGGRTYEFRVGGNSVSAFGAGVLTLTFTCDADFNGDGFLDFFDIDGYVACFEGTECPPGKDADFNHDAFVDFFDIDAFVTAFELGC